MAYCPKCGKKLKEGVKFCTECGAPISSGVPAKTPKTVRKKPVAGPRKIGTTGIVAIVAIIAVAGIAAFLLLKGDGGPGGLPEYPGSESFDIPEEYLGEFGLPEGVEMGAYLSDATVQEILNWYKGQMTG